VRWVASRGLGYEYRWDVNDDGVLESEEWTQQADVTVPYEEPDYVGVALIFPGDRPGEIATLDVEEETRAIPESLLPRGWETDAEGDRTPPAVHWDAEERKLVVRVNDAHVRGPGEVMDGTLSLAPGDMLQIGNGFVRVAPVVRARVEIRNAFGNVLEATEVKVLEPDPPGQRVENRQGSPQARAVGSGGVRAEGAGGPRNTMQAMLVGGGE